MTRLLLTAACAALLCACSGRDTRAQPHVKGSSVARAAAAGQSSVGPPEETRPPNRPETPAFPGQTRAPKITTNTAFQVVTVARGLDHPWGLAFLPDGRMLVTERPGRLRIVTADGKLSPALGGLPKTARGGQMGLYGLALDPHFAANRLVYLAYSAPAAGGSQLAVARGRLAEGSAPALQDVQVIFRAVPVESGENNIGGRLVFAPDGKLFVTVGDRFETRDLAQNLSTDLGKIIRINADGSIPKDNPFVGKAGARPEIWSYGHRNPESAAINPWTHQLWIVEHGPRGGDEINIPQPGKNYGWPVITYGEDYSGELIDRGLTKKAGMEQPIYYWDPVIAPSGMAFYDANLFPAWRGSLFVGGLASQHVARLTLKGDRVVGEEWLLGDMGERFRDEVVGPDGALYLLTDNDAGRILKLVPR